MTDTMTLRQAIESLRLKFTSRNSVPVDRATVTREEFDAINAAIKSRDVANSCMFLHQRGEGILPASPAGVPEGMVLYSSGGTSRVNDYKIGDDIYTAHEEYARGWNACRKRVAAAPSAPEDDGGAE